MTVYDASTRISAEFGGIQDLSRHLSLNHKVILKNCLAVCFKINTACVIGNGH